MENRTEGREAVGRFAISGTRSVPEIRHAVLHRLERLRIDPKPASDCLVAVTEACTNALLHGGSGKSESKTPQISWVINDSMAQFDVESFAGRGWSLAERSPPPSGELGGNSISGRVGGFGLHLMADLMDEVDLRIGAEGTRVRLVKRFDDRATWSPGN